MSLGLCKKEVHCDIGLDFGLVAKPTCQQDMFLLTVLLLRHWQG
jgi:hypothetical protein